MIIAAEDAQVQGFKGGEAKPHTPVEAPDSRASIDYIKMLLGLGEGEWEGGITGQDIYINDTPILAKDGSVNIPNVTWDFRPGTIDQTYIQGIPSVDNEVAQNVEVTNENFFTYSATNPELSALRVRIQFDALYQYQDNGDMVGAPLKYTVELQTGAGAWTTVVNGELNDKFTTKYSRTHRIDLPDNASGNWTIRVRKLTADVTTTKAANTMRVAAVAEVIDAKMVYPNTALLFVQFDASLYASTPKISVDAKGRKVRVPSNMDPVARTFDGVWDGTFKTAWTTDPVWHWYDIVLNRRFGLGRRIDATMVNKWALYRLSQYAGQQVSDGKGGTQPRFSCNVYIQRRQDAYRVLMDMASIFRGMSFWDGSSMTLNADMPDDVVYTFSPSNIIGQFETVSSARKERYNLTVVKWDNPANGYATQSRPVHNTKSQVRYGVWQTEITAIGCTDEAEAVRRGEWTNLTALYETHTVSFTCGVEGRNVPPGSIIAIADPDLAGKPMGGRIRGVAGRSITLDRDPDVVAGDTLRVVLPSGVAQERSIANVADRVVTVVASFTETPMVDSQWSVEREELVTVKYRVLNNDETDDGKGNRRIVAVEHNPSKYNAVDSGAKVEVPPVTAVPVASLSAPKNIIVTQNIFTDQGIAVTTMSVVWDQVASAVRYEVQWRRDNGTWVNAGVVTANGIDINSVYAGSYVVRVRAISSMDVYSVWGMSDTTGLQGKIEPPPTLAFIRASDDKVFSIEVTWGFRDGTSDTAYTELQTSLSANMDQATSLGQYAYPTDKLSVNGAASGVNVYFRGRLIDKSGNVGAWSEVARGQATIDPVKVNETLGEDFAKTVFGQQFFDDIELITADASVPGSVNARLKSVLDEVDASVAQVEQGLTDANQAIISIQQQIDNIGDLADSQEYKSDRTYSAGKIVTLNNSFYQAKVDVPAGKTPPDSTYWRDAGAIITQGDGLAARVTSAETTITQQGTAITANSGDITQLKSTIKDKADASALNALTTRVSSVEGVNTSQATAITNLQTSVTDINKNKADASALTALTNRVTTAEGSITSQGNNITQLQGSVKSNTDGLAATNQTVSNLSSTVTQQGTALTSQGQSITSINAALGDAGGENLLFNPSFDVWATDTQPCADGWEGGTDGAVVWSKQPSTLDPNGFMQRLTLTGLSDTKGAYLANAFAVNKVVAPSQQITLSVYMKATAGAQLYLAMRALDANQASLTYEESARTTANGQWQRITFTTTTPDNTVFTRFIPRVLGTASLANVVWDIDRAQLELGARATGWHDNGKTNIAAISAQATATSQLSGRVTNVEGTLTSQASSITSLRSALGNAGGQNYLFNPSFDKYTGSNGVADGWVRQGVTATPSVVKSGYKSTGNAQKAEATSGLSASQYVEFALAPAKRLTGMPGQEFTLSVYFKMNAGLRYEIYIIPFDSSVAQLAVAGKGGTASGNWERQSVTHTLPANTATFTVYLRMVGTSTLSSGTVEWDDAQVELNNVATGWKDNTGVLADQQDATATALSNLTTTVTNQGGSITSQAGQITSLQSSVKGAVQQAFNIVPNPTFDPLFTRMGFTVVSSTSAGVPAGCPFPWVVKTRLRDNFPDINALPNVPVKAGDVWRFTALVAAEANSGTRPFQHYASRATEPLGGRTAYAASPMVSVTQTWTRITWDHTIPAGMTFMGPFLQIETSGSDTATWYITDWHCENVTAAKNAQATADAAATATTNLGTRVTTVEGTVTAQSNQITALQAQISGVGSFAAAQNFEFLNTNRGFYMEQNASGATLTAYQQNLTLSGYANLRSPVFPDVNGAVNPIIRMRIRRKNTTRNPIRIYWANEDGGLAEARTATVNIDLNNTGWQDVELDLSTNTAWATKAKNNSIRFDILNAADTSAVVDIAYIAIGRRGAAASATALSDVQATVTQQATSITSLVSKTDTLQTTVNGQTSSIQQVTQIQNDTTQRLNASWQLKFATTGNNIRYVSGIGFSVDGNGSSDGNGQPNIQTTFAVAADRFLVMGPGIDGNGRTVFSVVNGQTYINEAFINKATIVNAIIGQSIQSAAQTNYGGPRMITDYNSGQITIRNASTDGRYIIAREDGIFMVSGGVVLLEMSLN